MATLLDRLPKSEEIDADIEKILAQLKLLRRMRKWAEEQEAINGVLTQDMTIVKQELIDGGQEVAYCEPAGLTKASIPTPTPIVRPSNGSSIAAPSASPFRLPTLDDDAGFTEEDDAAFEDEEAAPEPEPAPAKRVKRGAP